MEGQYIQYTISENGYIAPCPYKEECINVPAGCKGICYWCLRFEPRFWEKKESDISSLCGTKGHKEL